MSDEPKSLVDLKELYALELEEEEAREEAQAKADYLWKESLPIEEEEEEGPDFYDIIGEEYSHLIAD